MTLAVQQQDEIEVFVNEAGGISISQSRDLVCVLPKNVEALIQAIRKAKHAALEVKE
jgi:hypothetical protein